MTQEEAIEIINRNCTEGSQLREACAMFIPELSKSDDESVRKSIIHILQVGGYMSPEEKDKAFVYLEKMKEANKAIDVVDRIDKYIDENVANAHDMKDSNPDKKYYRGWDDALGEMARILQDVYSGEKQKEHKKENLRDFIDNFPYSDKQKEQKTADDEAKAIAYREYERGRESGLRDGQKYVLDNAESYGLCKPAEWSEEDENNLELVIDCIYKFYPDPVMKYKLKEWLKSLRPHWKPSEEQPQVADASKMEPEVDLEKEIDKVIADYSFTKTIDSGGFKTTVIDYAKIARHFYELGLNARKEK